MFLLGTSSCAVISGILLLPAKAHADGLAHSAVVPAFGILLGLSLLVSSGLCLSFLLMCALQYAYQRQVRWKDTWAIINEVAFVKLGLSTLTLAVIVALRDPADFASSRDVANAMPSLSKLFPMLPVRFEGLLGVMDPFNLWTFALYYIAFRVVWTTSKRKAALGAFVVALLPQLVVRSLASAGTSKPHTHRQFKTAHLGLAMPARIGYLEGAAFR